MVLVYIVVLTMVYLWCIVLSYLNNIHRRPIWIPHDCGDQRIVAEYLQVEAADVLNLITNGEMPAYRLGDTYRIAWQDLESFLQRQRTGYGTEEHAIVVTPVTPERHADPSPQTMRKDLDFEKRALDVLRNVHVQSGQERPFLTAYEIAVRIAQSMIAEGIEYDALGIPIGGQGSGQHRSLSKMAAIYLASRADIAERTTRPAAQSKTVDHHGRRITPSVPQVSAFRLKDLASPENNG